MKEYQTLAALTLVDPSLAGIVERFVEFLMAALHRRPAADAAPTLGAALFAHRPPRGRGGGVRGRGGGAIAR